MRERRSGGSVGPTSVRFVGGLGLVRVVGRSMEPALQAGDLLLVRRIAVPQPGDLVVLRLPGGRPLSIKRILRREPEGWWVERDNPNEGVDSWSVGAIPDHDLVATVRGRLWPLRRRVRSK